ncbi:CGNR zinc finger domain-containing protein [Microbispora hainanensis]
MASALPRQQAAADIRDTSRTARRRYCSQPCANRDAVRRHRARRSTPAT